MRPPTLSKWSYGESLEGLLYFAQTIQECLSNHTIDTYQAPATSIHTNLLELITLLHHYEQERIAKGSLDYVITEIQERSKSSFLINRYYSIYFNLLLSKLKGLKPTTTRGIINIATTIEETTRSTYWNNLIKEIKNTVISGNEKEALRELTLEFILEAEILGFSRGFVYFRAKHFFFDKNHYPKTITSPDQLDQFFQHFPAERNSWNFLFKCSDHALRHIETFKLCGINVTDKIPEGWSIPENCKHSFNDTEAYPLFIEVKEISEKDHFLAKDRAKKFIEIAVDICKFQDHRIKIDTLETCLAYDIKKKRFLKIAPPPNPLDFNTLENNNFFKQDPIHFIKILSGDVFTKQSRNSFIRLLDFHNAALSNDSPSTQLINMWASIEGFLPPPSSEKARIDHYLEMILPALVLTYPEKIFTYLALLLGKCNNSVKTLISQSDKTSTFFDNTIKILTCSDLSEEKSSLLNLLTKNPLLKIDAI